jgi:hypothetical protein
MGSVDFVRFLFFGGAVSFVFLVQTFDVKNFIVDKRGFYWLFAGEQALPCLYEDRFDRYFAVFCKIVLHLLVVVVRVSLLTFASWFMILLY